MSINMMGEFLDVKPLLLNDAVCMPKKVSASYYGVIVEGKERNWDIAEVEEDNQNRFYVYVVPTTGIYKGIPMIMEFILHIKNDPHGKILLGRHDFVFNFPFTSPFVRMVTPMWHTNINPHNGHICMDILKDPTKWSQSNTFASVIESILSLLDDQAADSSYNARCGATYRKCEQAYTAAVGGRKLSISEMDKLHEIHFAPFVKEVREFSINPKFLARYAKWFPQIKGVARAPSYYEEATKIYDTLRPKTEQELATQKSTQDTRAARLAKKAAAMMQQVQQAAPAGAPVGAPAGAPVGAPMPGARKPKNSIPQEEVE